MLVVTRETRLAFEQLSGHMRRFQVGSVWFSDVFRCFPFQLQILQIVISMKSQVWTVDLDRFMVDIWYEIYIDTIDLKSQWDGPNRDAQHGSRNTDLAGRAFNLDGKTDGVEAAGILGNPPAEGFQWNSNDFQNVKKTSQKGQRFPRDGESVYFNTVNSAELLSNVSTVRRFLHPPGRMFWCHCCDCSKPGLVY